MLTERLQSLVAVAIILTDPETRDLAGVSGMARHLVVFFMHIQGPRPSITIGVHVYGVAAASVGIGDTHECAFLPHSSNHLFVSAETAEGERLVKTRQIVLATSKDRCLEWRLKTSNTEEWLYQCW